MRFLLILLLPFSLSAQHFANDGTQNGTGTINDPFGLQYAFHGANGAISPGDTVTLLDGLYDDYYEVDAVYSDYVTYKGGLFINTPEGDSNHGGILTVTGKYIRFLGLDIQGGNPNRDSRYDGYTGEANGFYLLGGDHIEIVNCEIKNITGSGVYKSSACRDILIKGNVIFSNGVYSESNGRFAHHGLYIQNWEGSECVVEDNIIFHALQYGIQVWHQSSSEDSKLHNVKIRNNVFAGAVEVTTHYGGYNLVYDGEISGNYIYNNRSGRGLRMGYTEQSNINHTNTFLISDNYVNGNFELVNPRGNLIGVNGNTFVYDTYPFLMNWHYNEPIAEKIEDNVWYTNDARPFQWRKSSWSQETGKVIDFDERKSLEQSQEDDRINMGENWVFDFVDASNRSEVKQIGDDYYHIVWNPKLDDYYTIDAHKLDGVTVVDIENPGVILYQGEGNYIEVDLSLSEIEPIYGNIEQPPKTGKDFAVFKVSTYEVNPPIDPPIEPPIDPKPPLPTDYVTKQHFDSVMLNVIFNLNVRLDSIENLIKNHQVIIKVE